jgi:hypothetical protein
MSTQPGTFGTLAKSKAQVITCPACAAPVMFSRNHTPHIDACGFETYHFDCARCSAPLTGIIDPYDDALLISFSEP